MEKKEEQKKKFFDTKFGQFTKKLQKHIPSIVKTGLSIATGTAPLSVIGDLILNKKDDPHTSKEEKELLSNLYWEYRNNELDFQNDVFKTMAEDRKNAREREIEMKKLGSNSPVMKILAYAVIASYVGLMIALIFCTIPEENKLSLTHMQGIMEGLVLCIATYYFGDSKKSENDKKEI